MKIIHVILVLIVAVVLFFSLVEPEKANQPEKVSIAVSPSTLSSPIILAEQLGYFDKQGVDVELVPISGGVNCMKAMLNGEVDLATASTSVVMFTRFIREDFGVLASFAESDNHIKILIKSTDETVTSQMLEGRNLGLISGSAVEYFVDAYLYMVMEGKSSREMVAKKYFHPDEIGTAFRSGDIDAISIWEPYVSNILQQYPDDVRLFDTRGISHMHFLLLHLNDAKGEMVVSTDASQKILAAIEMANKFFVLNPERAREIVGKYIAISPSQLTDLWPDYMFRLSLSDALLLNLDMQAKWAINSGKIARQPIPNFRTLFALSPLFVDATMKEKR